MPKTQSRPQRWTAAITRARVLLDEAKALQEQLREKLQETVDALDDVKDIKEEYQEWYDNLPESLQNSPTAELLTTITELDLEPDAEDIESIETAIDEAENVELPRGFGRD